MSPRQVVRLARLVGGLFAASPFSRDIRRERIAAELYVEFRRNVGLTTPANVVAGWAVRDADALLAELERVPR